MDRLFDINLTAADGWTDGEQWDDCNPAQELNSIYHRIYSGSSEEDPNFRIEPGDGFFIGSSADTVRDWTPKTAPWNFDISGNETAPMTFKFGLQRGDNDIDTNLELHSPWITGITGEFIRLSADYHRFEGLKVKDSDPLFTMTQDCTGIQIHDAVFSNAALIDTKGYRMIGWILRKLTFLKTIFKALNIPLGSNTISIQDFTISGEGDIGISAEVGHYGIEIIGGEIVNDNHLFTDTGVPYNGLHLADGDEAIVRDVSVSGFSGTAHHFDCPVEVKYLRSSHDNAGIYFGKASTAHSCFVQWLRQIQGQSFAYWVKESLEITNSGCNLDETGGLGVFCVEEGATLTINGGDYQLRLPLPFLTAIGNCTVVLNNVMMNGVLFNETLALAAGEVWRGEKAEVTMDTLKVYANKALQLPYMHIPRLADAVSVQGSDKPFSSYIELPSGARILVKKEGSLTYMPGNAWLHLDPGEVGLDYFRYSTETEIYLHQFEIHPSPEVGAKVVQPDAFSGSGWTRVGETYTAEDTDNAISASYNFEEGEVYQISVSIDELTTGSIKPSIGNVEAEYSHSILGHEVWLIRAPANANSVSITGEALSGTISSIYVRKLLRNETPAVPNLSATVSGNDVTLDFEVLPVTRLRDTITADIVKTGLLDQNSEDGYRLADETKHYLFNDVYSTGKRNGINLRGGQSLEVYKFSCVGGYPDDATNARWQVGVVTDQNDGPHCEVTQIYSSDIDLLLESNYGDYQASNSDCVVINNMTSGENSYLRSAHLFNSSFKNSSDGITDSKKRTEVNHCYYEGGAKMLRCQRNTSVVCANTQFNRTVGTQSVFAAEYTTSLIEIWNSYIEDMRCVTNDQLYTTSKGFGSYADKGAIWYKKNSNHILKSYPTLDDLNRVACTDMEFEVSTDNGTNWSTLSVPKTGLPGVVGMFKRTLNFSSGNYDIRCRCLNGELVGAWSNTISISV